MAYFSLAFACDFLTATGRDNLIPKNIRRFRQTYFSSVIFPTAALIFTIFWPIFIYDRELLFPAFIDKIFSFKSNLVMHFCILPAVLWEHAFLPRYTPKSHRLNLGIYVFLYILYISFVLHTYYERGLFPYPIFMMTYGTIHFPIFIGLIFLLGIAFYLSQWKLYSLIWGHEKSRNGKKVKSS
uniref:Androgen-dependent TFPI-regulating protein-like n=1 Tax=Heliothis virescens TaxID=7102 RepID=A0A2A4J503_HELVI